MSQKQTVIDFLSSASTPKSIEEVHVTTGILRPNVRRILGQGEKEGTFTRTAKGVYTVTSDDGKVTAYIDCAEAEKSLPGLVEQGMKFNMIFLDSPYFSKALVGGNRGIKEYTFITPEQFRTVCECVTKLLADENSHVYVMLSGAPTAQADMARYVNAVTGAGLKLVKEGGYTKTFADGKPVTNVRGETAKPERLMLFTLSGQPQDVCINFVSKRPKGYATEKAKDFIRSLIEQSTKVGDMVGDFFGGSGVTAEQSIIIGRSVYIIEKSIETVTNYIKPRVEGAFLIYNFLNS